MIAEDDNVNRTVCLYGWIRGSSLKSQSAVHIPGYGDTRLSVVTQLSDPAPFPNKQAKRSLNQKERVIYAPFSGLGNILYDKDAVYIETGGAQAFVGGGEGTRNELLTAIGQNADNLDEQIKNTALRLLPEAAEIEEAVSDGVIVVSMQACCLDHR